VNSNELDKRLDESARMRADSASGPFERSHHIRPKYLLHDSAIDERSRKLKIGHRLLRSVLAVLWSTPIEAASDPVRRDPVTFKDVPKWDRSEITAGYRTSHAEGAVRRGVRPDAVLPGMLAREKRGF